MKKIFVLLMLSICIAHFAKAQFKMTEMKEDDNYYLERPKVDHIKEIELLTFKSGMNDTIVDMSKPVERKIRRFSEKGNEIEQIRYTSSDILFYKITFDYLNDTTVVTNYFNSNNELNFKISYKYNFKGLEIEADPYSSDGFAITKKTIYNYDKKDNLIEAAIYSRNGGVSKEIYLYNDKNQKIEIRVLDSGLDLKQTFSYDNSGNVQTETSSFNNYVVGGKVFSYSNLDSYGNWQKVSYIYRSSRSQGPGTTLEKHIVNRIITYYH